MKRLHKVKMIALIIVLTLGVNLLPVGANVITAGNMEKISSALLTAMSEAGSGEKLPVYIWTQDVDHTQVERQVQAKTGLSAESLVSR